MGEVRTFTQSDIEIMRGIVLDYIHMLTAREVPYNTAMIDSMITEARLFLNKIS